MERALASVETLQESVVTVRADGEHGKQLVGFYVPRAVEASAAGGDTLLRLEVSPLELRDELAGLLPRYAVPDYLVSLDELPRTPHGKVDTKALAAWDLTDLDTAAEDDRLPPTPAEAAVIDVWAGVLRTAHRPVPLSNFFALGGHSLHAAQVMARLRDRFQVDLPLRLLFENPTPRALAAKVEELTGAGTSGTSGTAGVAQGPRITRSEERREFPLALNQASLWFLNQVDPLDRSYENTTLLHLSGDLDVEALRGAVDTLVERHEILSVRFGSREGVPYQSVGEQAGLRLEVVDASAENLADPAAMKAHVRERAAGLRFDLEHGPLVVARLYRFAPTEYVLQWSSHHVVSDGWSTDVAIREITEAYLAHQEGRAPRLPELPVQYGDYALWQQGRPAAGSTPEAGFWRTYLEGYQGDIALVTDQERTEDRSRAAAHRVKDWDAGTKHRVDEFARARGSPRSWCSTRRRPPCCRASPSSRTW